MARPYPGRLTLDFATWLHARALTPHGFAEARDALTRRFIIALSRAWLWRHRQGGSPEDGLALDDVRRLITDCRLRVAPLADVTARLTPASLRSLAEAWIGMQECRAREALRRARSSPLRHRCVPTH